MESLISNARYAVANGNRCEGFAIIESLISNTRNAVGDSDGGEGAAIIESLISNALNAVRDGDGGEGAAIIESSLSNARYAIGDNCILTASNEGIGRSFNNRIAILAAIVGSIAAFDYHRGEGGAIFENINANARDAVGDGDGGEGAAKRESTTCN